MSVAPFLIIAAGICAEEREKREKERLAELAKKTSSEKEKYLCLQTSSWKNDEDIAQTYQDVLKGQLSFTSMQTYETRTIDIPDFFAFLTLYKEKESIVKLIKEQNLFKKTLDYSFLSISSFIKATNFRHSFAQGKNGYFLEQDLYDNRQEIFKCYCPEQRKPYCPVSTHLFQSYNFLQESFLENLSKNTFLLKKALNEDAVVPATIMASGDEKFLKLYRHFLEQSEILYIPDKKQIAESFKEAEELAQTPEYQNLFIDACPAIKTEWKWGCFPHKIVDRKGNYECPVIRKALERQNSR